MTAMTQKEAVVKFVKQELGSSFDPSVPARTLLSDDQIETIRGFIVSGINAGTIEFGKEITDQKELSRYVSGMVSNYLRKSKDLNGGNTYVPQSSGRGSRDPQVSELNKLLKTYKEGSEEYNEILSAIDSRKNQLIAEKTVVSKEKKKVKEFESINMDVLPENLKSFASTFMGSNN